MVPLQASRRLFWSKSSVTPKGEGQADTMSGMALSTPNFDSRIFKVAPWYGEQSIWFVRGFVPAMEGLFYDEVDMYCSFYTHVVLRTDPGGMNNPAGAGLAPSRRSASASTAR